jgi:potassium-transporting ATPase KdpC subunit
MIRNQLSASLRAIVVFTVLCGIAYPLLVAGVAQAGMTAQADGSLVERDGQVVGSRLLGQRFDGPGVFHSRPSAAGDGYDASASSASNLGPTNPDLLDSVEERVSAYREAEGLSGDVAVPVDAVTASGSGLDPHISVANARLQADRVAEETGIPKQEVLALIDQHTETSILGFLGEDGVNVLALNIDLIASS